MEILYRRRRATVEDIRAELPEAPGASSVRKLLEIMIERGLLDREYDGPRYVYFPAARVEQASRSALKLIIRTFFDNSPGSAMAALLVEGRIRHVRELVNLATRKAGACQTATKAVFEFARHEPLGRKEDAHSHST